MLFDLYFAVFAYCLVIRCLFSCLMLVDWPMRCSFVLVGVGMLVVLECGGDSACL